MTSEEILKWNYFRGQSLCSVHAQIKLSCYLTGGTFYTFSNADDPSQLFTCAKNSKWTGGEVKCCDAACNVRLL